MSEQEEFEFRARAEAEAAQAKKGEPGYGMTFAGSLAKGVQNIALTGPKLLGKGLSALGDLTSGAPSISSLVSGDKPASALGRAGKWVQDTVGGAKSGLVDELAPYKAANPMTALAGETAGEILATAPAGGAIGGGVKALASLPRLAAAAPKLDALGTAIASGGMRTGAGLAKTAPIGARAADMATRMAGGAINGGATGALINPDQAGTSALIGGALPPALVGVGKVARYAGRTGKALVQPFTAAGQSNIAAKVIDKFGAGGPMEINAAELVPGSLPTLAESTGNAGIAGLQRVARDVNPNGFALREKGNAAARTAAFDDLAGDAAQLEFYRASRSQAGKELYDAALDRVPEATTPYMKGLVTQLLKRPSINTATRKAQEWAIERGEKPYMNGSMRGLHDTKTALDDMINEAVLKGQGGHAKALEATQAKLLNVMEKMSPEYAEARATYAAMSQPVNAMEHLQGMRVTDATGNMTLSKTKNALEAIERLRGAPGIHPAKSVTAEQLKKLEAIHADLLRQNNLSLGKSAGSNTFQNIATDNILGEALPGKLGALAIGKIGGVAGQVGKLAYSGPNAAIRNQLADMMLDPELARAALKRLNSSSGPSALDRFLGQRSIQSLPRLAPAATQDRK
jgi:hypothetical protein